MSGEKCPLCDALCPEPFDFERHYFRCVTCDLRFLRSDKRLGPEEERARYSQHNNDVEDPNYQRFVEPLFAALRPRVVTGARGLDFGAGSGPVLAQMFARDGFQMEVYDPYFWPDRRALDAPYDFIVASEVAEHLYSPHKEFERLYALLKPGGWLGVMTLLCAPDLDFANWYYRRDPTHVVFYSQSSFRWLAAQLGFTNLTFSSERIVLMQRPL